jgi:Fe-Mn family superoxide dismutase
MYEHSYHIDFGAKAGSYVDAFMQAIAWKTADRLLSDIANHGGQAGIVKGASDA